MLVPQLGKLIKWKRRPLGKPCEWVDGKVVDIAIGTDVRFVVEFQGYDGAYYRRVRRDDVMTAEAAAAQQWLDENTTALFASLGWRSK